LAIVSTKLDDLPPRGNRSLTLALDFQRRPVPTPDTAKEGLKLSAILIETVRVGLSNQDKTE
jgi:hypothetical protein